MASSRQKKEIHVHNFFPLRKTNFVFLDAMNQAKNLIK